MKKFFGEFKKFITRGNVLDLAVGVIVGSAFTAIVTALTSNILQPVINWLLYLIAGKGGSLDGVFTFLVGSAEDLASAIYINWGAFLSAVINFILVAFVLFCIVKTMNKLQEGNQRLKADIAKSVLSKEDKAELKKKGISRFDKVKVEEYLKEKAEKEAALEEAKKAEEEAKAKAEREANPTVEDLLKEIKILLEKKG